MEETTRECLLIEFLISGEPVTDYFFDDAMLEDSFDFADKLNEISYPENPILMSTSDYSFFTGEILVESQALYIFADATRAEEIIKFTLDFFRDLDYNIEEHIIPHSEATEEVYQEKYEAMENALAASDARTKILEAIKNAGNPNESID